MSNDNPAQGIDPTGHLAAQFPELADIFERLDTPAETDFKTATRELRIIWKNGATLEGRMRAATAERFIREAQDSPLVRSFWLGSVRP